MPYTDHTNATLADLISLKGRTAVVTGGAAGIGRAISSVLPRRGPTR